MGAKAGVHKDVPADQRMLGAPATPDKEQMRIMMTLEKLPEIAARRKPKRVRTLVRRLESGAAFLEECAASADKTIGREKREERMRERLKEERIAIRDLLKEAKRARSKDLPSDHKFKANVESAKRIGSISNSSPVNIGSKGDGTDWFPGLMDSVSIAIG